MNWWSVEKYWGHVEFLYFSFMIVMKIPGILQLLATSALLKLKDIWEHFWLKTAHSCAHASGYYIWQCSFEKVGQGLKSSHWVLALALANSNLILYNFCTTGLMWNARKSVTPLHLRVFFNNCWFDHGLWALHINIWRRWSRRNWIL